MPNRKCKGIFNNILHFQTEQNITKKKNVIEAKNKVQGNIIPAVLLHTYGCNSLGSGGDGSFFNGPVDGPVLLVVATVAEAAAAADDDDDVSTSMTVQSPRALEVRPLLPSVKCSSLLLSG
jgi:hypothetical protein